MHSLDISHFFKTYTNNYSVVENDNFTLNFNGKIHLNIFTLDQSNIQSLMSLKIKSKKIR